MAVVGLVGRLLVATPKINDPNFERTVIFLLAHGEQGALGVVLNRPSASEASDLVPGWGERAADPARIFFGGPVGLDAVVGLGLGPADDRDGAVDGDEPGNGFRPVIDTLGTVDLNRAPEDVAGVDRVRLFAGSAGWGPGQLEAEIDERAWWVVPAAVADVVTDRPGDLWRHVLRRQPEPLRWFANHPADASSN